MITQKIASSGELEKYRGVFQTPSSIYDGAKKLN